MKHVLLFSLGFLITGMLYADNYVKYAGHYSTSNPGEILVEDIYNTYVSEPMYIPCPIEALGYTCNITVPVGRSVYTHPTVTIDGTSFGPVIGVFTDGVSNEWHSIHEANMVELENGANERVIKSGFTSSPYVIGEIDYGNGTKTIFYQIPDLSNSTKRIRVTTCPNTVSTPANDQNVWCVTNFAFVTGTAND